MGRSLPGHENTSTANWGKNMIKTIKVVSFSTFYSLSYYSGDDIWPEYCKKGGEASGEYTEKFSLEIGFEQLWDRLRKLNMFFNDNEKLG